MAGTEDSNCGKAKDSCATTAHDEPIIYTGGGATPFVASVAATLTFGMGAWSVYFGAVSYDGAAATNWGSGTDGVNEINKATGMKTLAATGASNEMLGDNGNAFNTTTGSFMNNTCVSGV